MAVKGKPIYTTTRKAYKAVKNFDHREFDEFCSRIYMNGYRDGKYSVKGVDIVQILEVISQVKGVGPALQGRIKEAVYEKFERGKEKEHVENV